MKTIPLTDGVAIEAALYAANGRATAHTYNCARHLVALAEHGEAELAALGIAKARRTGARLTVISGDRVAKSYARKASERIATCVTLIRRSNGWALLRARTVSVYQQGGGAPLLTLSPAQAAEAQANTAKRYRVQGETA